MVDSAGNLYGTTQSGGTNNWGTVFELSPQSSGTWTEAVLYNFCQNFDGYSCLDGGSPQAGLVSDSNGNLFGTTYYGGGFCGFASAGCGIVFELSPPRESGGAWQETVLYKFCQTGDNSCPDGAQPNDTLIVDTTGNFYGTTTLGGTNRVGGTVFELSPSSNGWNETVLYSFCSVGSPDKCQDGQAPMAAVTFDKMGNLYGTTSEGGSSKFRGGGVVYELSPGQTGWSETVLHVLTNAQGVDLLGAVNFDVSGNLYSTAFGGGQFGVGGVFRLSRQKGASEATLSFTGPNGAQPAAGVLINPQNGNIYGTTSAGGSDGAGTVFRIVGKTETVIYSFLGVANSDGATPMGALEADRQGNLYGTTKSGGQFDQGTLFEIIP